jgi:hypothetical protein
MKFNAAVALLLVVHASPIGTLLLAVWTENRYIEQVIIEQTIWQHAGLCLSARRHKQVRQEALIGWPYYTGARMSHAIKHNAID